MKLAKLFLIGCIVLLFFIVWFVSNLGPVDSHNTTQKLFVIELGASEKSIAQKLFKEGYVKNPYVFLIMKQIRYGTSIQAGDYLLSPSMNVDKLLTQLTHGTLDVWVTFPEGLRAEEYAPILEKSIATYSAAWIEALKSKNGYLFPDTYLIPKNASIDTILTLLQNNFSAKTKDLFAAHPSVPVSETIVIASLIEREAKFAEDKKLVSAVIHKRLSMGMPLQLDATVQYAIGYQEDSKTWWKKNLENEIGIASAYNTYKNVGLPPAPIANPGIESIKAALDFPETNYVYYVSDRFGHLHFAKTLEEHNINIEKYLK